MPNFFPHGDNGFPVVFQLILSLVAALPERGVEHRLHRLLDHNELRTALQGVAKLRHDMRSVGVVPAEIIDEVGPSGLRK